jgi:hypothetical protein
MQNNSDLVQDAEESVQMLDAVPAAIHQLDLTRETMILMQQQEWSLDFCNRVRTEYLRFLALSFWHRDDELMPSQIIDLLWHVHLRDNRKYQLDCQSALGFQLLHLVAHPPDTPESQQDPGRQRIWRDTLALYKTHFGGVPDQIWNRPPPCVKK